MKHLTKTLGLASCIILASGCSTYGDYQPNQYTTSKSESTLDTVQKTLIPEIFEMNKLHEQISGIKIESSTTLQVVDKNVKLVIDYEFESRKTIFKLGNYYLDSNSTEGAAIASTLIKTASLLSNRYPNGAFELHAEYFGCADATPYKSKTRYKGEYGDIHLSSDITTLNGIPTQITVKTGSLMNNTKLSALRAATIPFYVQTYSPIPIKAAKYTLCISKSSGPQHRFAKFKLIAYIPE